MVSSDLKPKTNIVHVMVLGLGAAGRSLLDQIADGRDRHAKHGLEIRVTAIWDARTLTAAKDIWSSGISNTILREMSVDPALTEGSILDMPSPASGPASDPAGAESGGFFTNLFKRPPSSSSANVSVYIDDKATAKALYIGKQLGSALVIVDCSQDDKSCSVLKSFLNSGCYLVLANQSPLVSDMSDFDELMKNQRRIRFDSAIGAGLPLVEPIRLMLHANGKRITSIVGSANESLSFVMTEVESGSSFSRAVLAGQARGIIPSDPRTILDGMDIVRKAMILARVIGYKINLGDIKVETIIKNKFMDSKLSVADFIAKGLRSSDDKVANRIKEVASKNKCLRYGFRIEHERVTVGFLQLQRTSGLVTNNNSVEIHINDYKQSPLIIQGAFLDDETKAETVLGEIYKLQDMVC